MEKKIEKVYILIFTSFLKLSHKNKIYLIIFADLFH